MKVCSSPARLAVLNLALAAAFPAFAQSQLAPVVVTAARVAQPLTDVVADVSLIDREQIERSGATGLADLLVRLPGVEFARNGGPGTTTSLFLRGAASNHTAVFIDGVRVDNPIYDNIVAAIEAKLNPGAPPPAATDAPGAVAPTTPAAAPAAPPAQ